VDRQSARCFVLSFASLFAFSAILFAQEIKQTRESEQKFIGAVGCRSSSCHGGAGEKRSAARFAIRHFNRSHKPDSLPPPIPMKAHRQSTFESWSPGAGL